MIFLLFQVLLEIISAQIPDISQVGVAQVKAWAQQLARTERDNFLQSGRTYLQSPLSWGEQVVYQIQVDRFNNGNLTNDNQNLPPVQTSQNLAEIGQWRHGGDIAGITQRLDYLVDLGITAIWITPILMHNGDYHGYCTSDFTRLDPGFATEEELHEFIEQSHQRGIYVLLDVVVNHICDESRLTSYLTQPNNRASCGSSLEATYWSGMSGTVDQGTMSFSNSFFPAFKTADFFCRCGANSESDTSGQSALTLFGDFVNGMFDLQTMNEDFQDIFTSLHQALVAKYDFDGLRMDAAKHVTADYIAYFSTQVRDFAYKMLNKQNFYVVGEVAADQDWIGTRLGNMYTNPVNPDDRGNVPQTVTNRLWDIKDTYLAHPFSPYPGLNGIFDFYLSGTTKEALLGGTYTPSGWYDYLRPNNWFNTLKAQNDPRLNWILLEIHDWVRYNKGLTNTDRAMVGLTTLLTEMGSPIIYYGLEQGFTGVCNLTNINFTSEIQSAISSRCGGYDHALSRQDMFLSGPWKLGSVVPSIQALSYIGPMTASPPTNWETDPFLARDHALYKLTRKLVSLRKSCEPLRSGSMVTRDIPTNTQVNGAIAFSRLTDSAEILVIVKTPGPAATVSRVQVDGVINPIAGIKYVNALNLSEAVWSGSENGITYLYFQDSVTLSGPNMFVFVRESYLEPWNSTLGVALCKKCMSPSCAGCLDDNCDSCGSTTPNVCQRCHPGYYVSNGVCVACSDSCGAGYIYNFARCLGGILDSCQPVTCPTGAVSGMSSEGPTCTCAGAFYGTPVWNSSSLTWSDACQRCSSNCGSCVSASNCSTCNSGYALINNQCVACATGCSSCDASGCLTCAPNYYFNSTTTCAACRAGNCGVGKFYNSTRCLNSNDGCSNCGMNCLICQSATRCTTCATNYALQNNTCIDTTAPVISNCPSDVTVYVVGSAGGYAYWTEPTAFDAVDGTVLAEQRAGPPANSWLARSSTPILVQYRFADSHNNSATCAFQISFKVMDSRIGRINITLSCVSTTNRTTILNNLVNQLISSTSCASDQIINIGYKFTNDNTLIALLAIYESKLAGGLPVNTIINSIRADYTNELVQFCPVSGSVTYVPAYYSGRGGNGNSLKSGQVVAIIIGVIIAISIIAYIRIRTRRYFNNLQKQQNIQIDLNEIPGSDNPSSEPDRS